MKDKIEKILDEKIRPSLAIHGGNVELVDIIEDEVQLILKGGCQGCAVSNVTLYQGIEQIIKEDYPKMKVRDLTNHSEGDNPYYEYTNGDSPLV